MIAPARRAALDALMAIEGGADLPEALARTRERLPEDRDRSLSAAIVIGTLRWRGRLDYHLAGASARPLDRLDRVVLEILRLSLFQLLFLERVPASAAVDDAVSLTRRAGKTSAGGFVNGVLRALARSRSRLSLPPLPAAIASAADRDAAVESLSVAGSHPRWLVARWVDRLGLDRARAWIEFDNLEAPLTLRANLRRGSRDALAARLRQAGVETVATRFAPAGLVVTGGNPLRGAAGSTPGDFLAQDEASQLVPLMMGVRPGDRVLDACAAPGGKTLALADALGGAGLLVAADLRDRRVTALRQLLDAADAPARIVRHDLDHGAPFGACFDRVLVDAPCTGLGTLRRDVDIRWRRQEHDIAAAAARQRRLLVEAASVVRPGGRLVYATCSSEPEENEAVVEAFLATRTDFRPVPTGALAEAGVPTAVLAPATGWLETSPDRHGLECFFAAALERQPV